MTRTRGRRTGEGDAAQTPKRRRHRYNLRATSSREKRNKKLGDNLEGRRNVMSDEDFREKNKSLKLETIGDALTVESINWQKDENQKNHNTDEYELESLIVRRGQGFSISITFDRDISKEKDVIFVQFTTGARPQESKGTLMRIPINVKEQNKTGDTVGDWLVEVTEVKEKSVTFTVSTEPDSIIGKYETFVETKLTGSTKDFSRSEVDAVFYVIFNPWCKDDVVYMENKEKRFEYVLNDTGRIWIGNEYCNRGLPWNFGQFESPCLEVALDLLDKGELVDAARGSVVAIVRTISALANSMDEEGVLEGRWTKDYPKNCKKPWEWIGSAAILEQFHNTGKPVQFGQCWVFSGVITTLMRALGVPTRSVTNFKSAHDNDCSMTIDKHWDEEGNPIEEIDDSVWNFHVWNESWFRRQDLPKGYDGWQAHDATPQEYSEGVMRCGPASLKAVKEGHVYLNYDVGFIFAEVNGDRIKWEVKEDGSMEVMEIDEYSVGKCISTKAVGSDDREDLTWDYKFREGTDQERSVIKFVNQFSTRRKEKIYKIRLEKQVKFKLVIPENTLVGEDIKIGVVVENLVKEDRTIRVRLTLTSVFYTGIVDKRVKGETTEVDLKSEKETKVMMTVTPEEYESLMNSQADFELFVSCRVMETKRMFTAEQAFSLKKPGLDIKVPKKVGCMVESKAVVTFKNFTNLNLHNGVFHVEGSYVVKATAINTKRLIKPGEEVKAEVTMYPRRTGTRLIMASFGSDELAGVDGEAKVNILRKNDWLEYAEEKEKEEEEKDIEKEAASGDSEEES